MILFIQILHSLSKDNWQFQKHLLISCIEDLVIKTGVLGKILLENFFVVWLRRIILHRWANLWRVIEKVVVRFLYLILKIHKVGLVFRLYQDFFLLSDSEIRFRQVKKRFFLNYDFKCYRCFFLYRTLNLLLVLLAFRHSFLFH